MPPMYSVRQIAKSLNRSDGAIRQWGKEFAAHLSESANPPKGHNREYTLADYKILATVSVLSSQGESYEKIHDALESGVRLEQENTPQEPLESAQKGDLSPDVTQAFTTALAAYETRISRLESRIESQRREYEQKLDTERAARLVAEIERAKLEGRLEELLATKPPSFWRRLFGVE